MPVYLQIIAQIPDTKYRYYQCLVSISGISCICKVKLSVSVSAILGLYLHGIGAIPKFVVLHTIGILCPNKTTVNWKPLSLSV